MRFFEIEQKYRIKDPKKIRTVLKKMGAKSLARGIETNEFYDRGGFFKKQKVALRLRRFGKQLPTLTLKGPRIKSGFTKRVEIETPVEYATARALLRFLGCRRARRYSKIREIYKTGKILVTVDFLKKFGWFLEIEGQPSAIKKIEKRLGLSREDREEKSYLHMLFNMKH
jgi:predicted adenylyl cyclase CyaB